ncbi:protein TIME FOR COFFEE isoform X1 [Cucumis melo var. makuwa]|uniref:Protein TIME FOR COFFEE isoform X1 n=1 Tax=Cucumis melo var. makuwa TaxID=1194695 RepID=A0A5A7V8Y6_CUCMM|nr:protein TIME FOR COFFEE isoform X1 [Cucumis melo var. makuwa]TYK26237.1 protein TIME FOR COFFEE isoform X1 [Cucumis melo var. makuwa]
MIMEKNREARSSSSIVAANGSSRRRSRATAFRDLPEEGQVELQETVRLRDRGGKRERDREFVSRSKRRREGGNREEEMEEEEGGDTSAEDIVADGDSDGVEDGGVGVSRILSSTTTASSVSNQNQKRNSLPPRVVKQQWKVADDAMIGVPVPRKARSASVKRSHDCTVSGNSGVGGAGEDIADDHSHRNQTDSPARSSAEVVSPSTSIISAKKKMKPTGPKTRSMKTSNVSSASAKEGDIEIEIAEVLFGLKKQPQHCSKKQEVNMKQSSKQETENSSVLRDGSKSSITSTMANSAQTAFNKSVSLQKNDVISDLSLNVAGEKQKVDSLPLDFAVKGESEKPAEIAIYPSKLEGASEESKPAKEVFTGGDENKGSKRTGLAQEDITSCAKGDVDPEDSPPNKSIPEAVTQKEEKFKFDLMAPPTSPERDGLADMVLDTKPLSLGIEMGKETSSKVENEVEGLKEKEKVINEDKIVTSGAKFEFFKLDLEKPQLDSNNITMQEQSPKQQPKGAASTVEKNEPSTSVRLPIILGGWPTTEIPSVGYMPPFRTVLPVDSVDKSSTKLQHLNFILSHPRPKRCLTHYDIARNIYLHQQFTKTNYFHPAGDASASLAEAKLKNISSKEGTLLSNPLSGNHLDVNLNSVRQKEQGEGDLPGNVVNDKSSEAANFADIAKSKQLVFHQKQGVPFGNSMPSSGFIFPIGQHQASVAQATANQSGSAKSSNNQSTSLFSNPETGTLVSFPAFPAVSTNMSYSHPNVVSVEAPYLAKLQNNGYPFTFSTPAGTSATYRTNNAQPLPLFNGSFYSSQMFHPSQIQPAQTQSHHQPSGSHKQPQTQPQQWSVHVPGNNVLPSNGMQVKQSTEQHLPLSNQSRKHENETSGEDTTSLSDKRAAPVQKNAYGQNYILPVQALGFTLMPSTTLNNGNSGNYGEKKQSHPQNLKNTVALVPSQGLTMSFASYNGNGTPSNLNFSPISQNTTVYQNLPDIQRTGFQVAPVPQATKQKNHQTSEGRNGVVLSGASDRNTGNSSTKPSAATSGQTLVFGNPSRTLNFMTSSVPVNWPSPSTKSAATTNRPAGSSSGNQQQQPLPQLPQQQHILQQQQAAMAPRMAPRTKVPTNNTLPSSATTKFPCNPPPGFSQPLIQCDNSIQSPVQKNSGRMTASVVPTTSLHLSSSSTPVHKNSIQQKGSSTPQGQTQISFGGGDFKPAYTPMQHIPTSGHSPSSSGKLRNTTSKTNPSVTPAQQKQDESSSTGAGQKSSPVCGRNVPSILNTCPSQLSELKY